MTDLEMYELVNSAETSEMLEYAIGQIAKEQTDDQGFINGRTRQFNATRMAVNVKGVVEGQLAANLLTRSFGIRQQALYLREYHK